MDESARARRLAIFYLLATILVSLLLPWLTADRPPTVSQWMLRAFCCEVLLSIFGGAVFMLLGFVVALFTGDSQPSRLLIGVGATLGCLFFLALSVLGSFFKDDASRS